MSVVLTPAMYEEYVKPFKTLPDELKEEIYKCHLKNYYHNEWQCKIGNHAFSKKDENIIKCRRCNYEVWTHDPGLSGCLFGFVVNGKVSIHTDNFHYDGLQLQIEWGPMNKNMLVKLCSDPLLNPEKIFILAKFTFESNVVCPERKEFTPTSMYEKVPEVNPLTEKPITVTFPTEIAWHSFASIYHYLRRMIANCKPKKK
jgi:hypothetical protein